MPSASQASASPDTDRSSCQAGPAFSGLPKLRQLVTASGSAPTQARLAAPSSIASTVAVDGDRDRGAGLGHAQYRRIGGFRASHRARADDRVVLLERPSLGSD